LCISKYTGALNRVGGAQTTLRGVAATCKKQARIIPVLPKYTSDIGPKSPDLEKDRPKGVK
jgi:hypothetical protein